MVPEEKPDGTPPQDDVLGPPPVDLDPPPIPGGVTAEEAPSAGGQLESSLEDRLTAVEKLQVELLEYFEEKYRRDATHKEFIDRLHAELQDYRDDMIKKIKLPILKDVIRINDELLKFVSARRMFTEERRDWDNLLDNVVSFGDDLLELLDRYGLESFTGEVGETFDPRTQRASKTVATQDPDMNKTVAELLRPGFRIEEQIIRNEEVAVYRLIIADQG